MTGDWQIMPDGSGRVREPKVTIPPFDVKQQRCGDERAFINDAEEIAFEPCIAWRLSKPGSNGNEWRQCWNCGSRKAPTGECYVGTNERERV